MREPKLIIVEGIDSTGKTSLCQSIAHARTPKPVLFNCTASPDMFAALHDYHLNVAKFARTNLALGHDVVLDRFWPSEITYGRLFRPDSGYEQGVGAILKSISDLDVTYVNCFSAYAMTRYFEDSKPDPAHQLSRKDFETIQSAYGSLFCDLAHTEHVVHFQIELHGSSITLPRFIQNLFGEGVQ